MDVSLALSRMSIEGSKGHTRELSLPVGIRQASEGTVIEGMR